MNRNALLTVVLLGSAGPVSASALTNIGVAAAVRGSIRAQAPGQTVGREVTSGKPVFLNDHVTTGDGARMQILLLDETTFTIGPNSDMVLDEFVYDPATGAGKVSAQITKGVFRFVTGKVAQRRPADMKVSLPVGTIGIRGTMVAGQVNGRNADVMLVGPGPDNNAQERPGGITVTNGQGSTDIDASGYGTSIVNGGAPTAGYRFSPEQVNGILGPLSGPNGASNGAGAPAGQTASDGGPSGPASQTSGQDTASGGVNYQTTATSLVAQNNDTSSFASQQAQAPTSADVGGADGLSTWDQILAIPSGTGEYEFSGSYAGCTACGTTPSLVTGSISAIIPVDFGAQLLGGNILGRQGFISISGGLSDQQYLNSVSMSAFASQVPAGTQAIYPFTSTDLQSSFNGGSFVGSSLQFNNVAGQAGKSATLTVVYNNTTLDAGGAGTTTATKVPIPPL